MSIHDEVIEYNRQYKQETVFEDDKMFIKTTHFDKAQQDFNNKVKQENIFNKAKLDLHHDEDLRAVISCPSTLQWSTFQQDNPHIYKDLMSSTESERMKAVRQISLLHPTWIQYARL